MKRNKLFLPYFLLLTSAILITPFWTLQCPGDISLSMLFLICCPSSDLLPQLLDWCILRCRELQDGFNPTTKAKLRRVARSRIFKLVSGTVCLMNMLGCAVFQWVDFSDNTDHWFPLIQLCKSMFEALNFTPNRPWFYSKLFLLNWVFLILKYVDTFDVLYITNFRGSNTRRMWKLHLERRLWGVACLISPIVFLSLWLYMLLWL